jgi:hypothetical protein
MIAVGALTARERTEGVGPGRRSPHPQKSPGGGHQPFGGHRNHCVMKGDVALTGL